MINLHDSLHLSTCIVGEVLLHTRFVLIGNFNRLFPEYLSPSSFGGNRKGVGRLARQGRTQFVALDDIGGVTAELFGNFHHLSLLSCSPILAINNLIVTATEWPTLFFLSLSFSLVKQRKG